ncbi:MAG: hypothetical protein HZC02_00705 [Candidatus Levybacteria bacterium]|nr:hypothetical protein [Candidatus Levybacteria bacterium]
MNVSITPATDKLPAISVDGVRGLLSRMQGINVCLDPALADVRVIVIHQPIVADPDTIAMRHLEAFVQAQSLESPFAIVYTHATNKGTNPLKHACLMEHYEDKGNKQFFFCVDDLITHWRELGLIPSPMY